MSLTWFVQMVNLCSSWWTIRFVIKEAIATEARGEEFVQSSVDRERLQ